MKKCNECNEELEKDALFCANCGAKVEEDQEEIGKYEKIASNTYKKGIDAFENIKEEQKNLKNELIDGMKNNKNKNLNSKLKNDNYGLYYVIIFRVLNIIVSLFIVFILLSQNYGNRGFIDFLYAIAVAALYYFVANFLLKLFENVARIGKNIETLVNIENSMSKRGNDDVL